MRKVGKFFLRVLGLLGILALCFFSIFSYLVFEDTKFLGVVFLASGIWGIFDISGVVRPGSFRESKTNQIIGTVGAIIVGIYFLLR
jgi:hypothetical protein